MGYAIIEYPSGVRVPTVELGSGDVRIGASLNVEEGKAGVAFAETEPGPIGRDLPTPEGSTVASLDCFFQIESTSAESLLVLREYIDEAIGHLQEIKAGGTHKDVYTQHPLRESMEDTLTETPTQSLHDRDMAVAERVREVFLSRAKALEFLSVSDIRNLDLSEAIK